MLKIELITNYFAPEMGAAASRMLALAKGLQDLGHNVEVIAPMPNYPDKKVYEGYRNKFRILETIEDIKVRRYWVAPSLFSDTMFRFFGMLSFPVSLWTNLFHLLKRKPDIVIVQNTPLLVSFSALLLSKLLPDCKKILNVSDLWPLTAAETGLIDKKERKYKIMEWLESYNYRSAHLIAGQSREIIEYIKKKVDKPFFLYRNISPEYQILQTRLEKYYHGNPKIVYAGLLSSFQGVFEICKKINFREIGAEFHIYGSGDEEEKIRRYIEEHPEVKIYFHGRLTRPELHEKLPEYHASIVPLANQIYGAVPSKIFELISFNVPVLFCGSGEGADIIKENNLGFVSDPGDFKTLEKNIGRLKLLSEDEYKRILLNCIHFTEDKLNFEKQLERLDQEMHRLVEK